MQLFSWGEIFLILVIFIWVLNPKDFPETARKTAFGIRRMRFIYRRWIDNVDRFLEDLDQKETQELLSKNYPKGFSEELEKQEKISNLDVNKS